MRLPIRVHVWRWCCHHPLHRVGLRQGAPIFREIGGPPKTRSPTCRSERVVRRSSSLICADNLDARSVLIVVFREGREIGSSALHAFSVRALSSTLATTRTSSSPVTDPRDAPDRTVFLLDAYGGGVTLGVELLDSSRAARRIGHMGHVSAASILGVLGVVEAALLVIETRRRLRSSRRISLDRQVVLITRCQAPKVPGTVGRRVSSALARPMAP